MKAASISKGRRCARQLSDCKFENNFYAAGKSKTLLCGNQQIFGAKQQVRARARRPTEADKASPSAAQFGLERVHGSDEQMFGAE
jgi:hypothetical protein